MSNLREIWDSSRSMVGGVAIVVICFLIVGYFIAPDMTVAPQPLGVGNPRTVDRVVVKEQTPVDPDEEIKKAARDALREVEVTSRAAALALENLAADLDRQSRLRSASAILKPNMQVVDSVEVEVNKRFAFLMRHPDGTYFSQFVDNGIASDQYFSRDRFDWETHSTDALVVIWADRVEPGAYQVIGVKRDPYSISAIVANRATAKRYRFEMVGFEVAGDAIVSLSPLDD